MTDHLDIMNINGAHVPSATNKPRFPLTPVIVAALLCGGLTALCGVSHSALAVTFGGLLAITIALPPLAVASDRWLDAVLITIASITAVILVWLWLAISWPQWWACTLVLTAFSFAVAATTMLLARIGTHAVVSAAIVLVIALAWLSWPVWLSPYLAGHQTLVNALVAGHPLLAVNGTLIDEEIWTERPQMYGWTALNQDVSFSMPASVFWCVILHAGIGVASVSPITIALLRRRGMVQHRNSVKA